MATKTTVESSKHAFSNCPFHLECMEILTPDPPTHIYLLDTGCPFDFVLILSASSFSHRSKKKMVTNV